MAREWRIEFLHCLCDVGRNLRMNPGAPTQRFHDILP